MEKTCERCKKTFIPRVYWQRFCSPECRLADNKEAYREAHKIVKKRRSTPPKEEPGDPPGEQ